MWIDKYKNKYQHGHVYWSVFKYISIAAQGYLVAITLMNKHSNQIFVLK